MRYVDVLLYEAGSLQDIHCGLSNVSEIRHIGFCSNYDDEPLVSCLMVTRGDVGFVQSAIDLFMFQTYLNRELIIIIDNLSEEINSLINMHEKNRIRFKYIQDKKTLGELRNIAVSEAKGEIICQWDDDDIYHPERISFFVNILRNFDAAACFLLRWIFWDIKNKRLSISEERIWEGSIFAWKEKLCPYPHLSKEEDSIAIIELAKTSKIAVVDNPYMYIYTHHGGNTWDIAHMNRIYDSSSVLLNYPFIVKRLANVLPIFTHPSLDMNHARQFEEIFCDKQNRLNDFELQEIYRSIEERRKWYRRTLYKNMFIQYIPLSIIKLIAEALMTCGRRAKVAVINRAGNYLWKKYMSRQLQLKI